MRIISFSNPSGAAVVPWLVDADCAIVGLPKGLLNVLFTTDPQISNATWVGTPGSTSVLTQLYLTNNDTQIGLNFPLLKGESLLCSFSAAGRAQVYLSDLPIA